MTFQFFLLCSLIILASSMLQGLTGFGFSILSLPLLTLLLSPKIAVPILVLYSIIINIVVFFSARKAFELNRIWILMIFGIIGVPIGTHFLITFNDNLIKLCIGIFITVFGLLLLLGFRQKIKHEKVSMIPIGFVSGILSGSVSIGGPPVILFLSNQGVNKQVFRANLAVYFFILNIFTIPVYIYTGLISEQVLNYSIKFFPALVIGVVAGNVFSKKIKEEHFRKVVLVLLVLMGILSIVSSLKTI